MANGKLYLIIQGKFSFSKIENIRPFVRPDVQ